MPQLPRHFCSVFFNSDSLYMRNGGTFCLNTVKPRFNEPLFNELLGITNNIFRPGKSYSKMYGTEPRFNEPRFNELPDLTNRCRQPKLKMYLKFTSI